MFCIGIHHNTPIFWRIHTSTAKFTRKLVICFTVATVWFILCPLLVRAVHWLMGTNGPDRWILPVDIRYSRIVMNILIEY